MKKLNLLTVVLFGSLACSTVQLAYAWDNPGHMAVAGLAYDELSGTQQRRLVALLRKHPGLALVTAGFPSGDPGDRDLAMAAATWPDLAKQSRDYANNGYEADQPAVVKVEFDHKQHRGWHFIDIPLWVGEGPAATLPPTPEVNAVGVVKVLVAQLRTTEADEAKAYDLGWLLHLVGDLHQPLHAVTGVSETYPKGDTGGNDVRLDGVTRSESELHAFWDDILGKSARSDKRTKRPRLDKDIVTASGIITDLEGTSLGADSDNVDPARWASESFNLAQRDVYALELRVVQGDRGDTLRATLDDDYGQSAVSDAKLRIRLAGHRLALILADILK